MTIKLKAECLEFLNDAPIFEAGEPPHSSIPR
jgi:hypothetical protein